MKEIGQSSAEKKEALKQEMNQLNTSLD